MPGSTTIASQAGTDTSNRSLVVPASSLEASYLIRLETEFPAGTTQRYRGTLGPYAITSASGSPKWRGSWQKTLDFGTARLTGTAYYTSGYGAEAEDADGERGVCPSGTSVAFFEDVVTPVKCNVGSTFNLDMTGSIDVSKQMPFYINVLNILGRFFRVGARMNF